MTLVASRTHLSFVAYGEPIGQAAIAYSRNGRGYYPNGKVLKPWRATIADAAKVAIAELDDEQKVRYPLIKGLPLDLAVTFWLTKPKTVRRTWPTVPPDKQHLVRACEDALTGVAWHDDAQVVHTDAWKRYVSPGGKPCAVISIRTLELL